MTFSFYFILSKFLTAAIDPFTKRHRLVHNGGFPKSEALYCSPNMISSTEVSLNFSNRVKSSKTQSLKPVEKLITVFDYIRHYGAVILLLCMTTSGIGL